MDTQPTKFKRDHHQRAQLFHPDSFKHSGRANLNLLSALLQYAPGGEIVLDPMGGTGSILIATDHQHPVVCGELEGHWAFISEANRKSIAGQRLIAASTPALCCQWDASRLPLASGSIPFIITSPPYWDMLSDWHINSKGLQDSHEIYGPAYGLDPRNLGNVHIYEDYLRAMALVYCECHRLLGPGRKLVLILKDRVHKFKRVPLVRDTIALCTALGFNLVGHVERETIPSLHRRTNMLHNPESETVDTEVSLIFSKAEKPLGPVKRFALVQAPKPESAPSWQLYVKQWNYAAARADNTLLLTQHGLSELPFFDSKGSEVVKRSEAVFFDWGPNLTSFRRRKEFAFACASDIVTKFGFAAGDEIEFHGSMAYGQYLRQRLTTLGGLVSIPTEGLNLGQKLKWYTECDQAQRGHNNCDLATSQETQL